jgi:hypothetical protein
MGGGRLVVGLCGIKYQEISMILSDLPLLTQSSFSQVVYNYLENLGHQGREQLLFLPLK